MNKLTPEEVAEAKRQWREEFEDCKRAIEAAAEEGMIIPLTEEGWMDYCQWCCEEFGASPFGT